MRIRTRKRIRSKSRIKSETPVAAREILLLIFALALHHLPNRNLDPNLVFT